MRGWLVSDIDQLNILSARDWAHCFNVGSIDAILAEHVWEHLSREQAIEAAELCMRYLRPGGRLRIAVPDGLHPNLEYREAVKPGGSGDGAHDHKVLYTWRSLIAVFNQAGFTTYLLEYFDESSEFHMVPWDPADGIIHRSAKHDGRNKDGELRYTSIILDAVKPARAG